MLKFSWIVIAGFCFRRGIFEVRPTAPDRMFDCGHPHAGNVWSGIAGQTERRALQDSDQSSSQHTATQKMRMQALRAGAVEFLAKPFDDEALLGSVRAALES